MQFREEIRVQNDLSKEIVDAITGNQIGDPIDDEELEAELENMQQEQLDEQMLKSGTVPVADEIHRMPNAPKSKITEYPVSENIANRMPAAEKKAPVEDDEEEELRKLQAEMAM